MGARVRAATGLIRKLVIAFYSNAFRVGRFVRQHPEHQGHLTDLLIGRIFSPDVGRIFDDLEPWLADAQKARTISRLAGHHRLNPHRRRSGAFWHQTTALWRPNWVRIDPSFRHARRVGKACKSLHDNASDGLARGLPRVARRLLNVVSWFAKLTPFRPPACGRLATNPGWLPHRQLAFPPRDHQNEPQVPPQHLRFFFGGIAPRHRPPFCFCYCSCSCFAPARPYSYSRPDGQGTE